MVRTTIRTILLAGMAGSVVWWLWWGGSVPDDAFPAWTEPVIVVSLLSPCYLLAGLVRSGAVRKGPIGIGTVVGVRRTGIAVNDRPQLAIGLTVRTADGQTFDSVAKEFIDVSGIAAMVPGTVLPVRYAPGRTDEVAVDRGADPAAVQAVLNQVHIRAGLSSPHLVDIAARGVRANAVVAAARPTGRLVGGNPELVLTLLVNRADGTSFETVVDKVIAANLVGHIQVGRVVTVHYLPGAEHEVALQLPVNPHL